MKARNSNIELLRLICIFIIILHHLVLYSNIDIVNSYSINTFFYSLFMVGGKLGANCFFAITSYYLVLKSSKQINKNKIIKTHNIMLFYSVLFLILGVVLKIRSISTIDVLEGIFPLAYNSYWFVSSYILLLLFSPLLNIVIERINQSEFKKVLIILLSILSINAFLPKADLLYDSQHFIVTIFIYMVIGYIIKFKKNKIDNRKLWLALIINILLIICSSFIMIILGNFLHLDLLMEHSFYLMSGESIFMIIASISLFYLFLNKKEFRNRFVNYISTVTLDIYLIHMNHIIYLYIWNELFAINKLFDKPLFPLYSIIITIIVFAVCAIIGVIRQFIFKIIENIYCLIINIKRKKEN